MKKLVALLLAAVMVLGMASAFADTTELTLWSIAVESDSSYQSYIDAIAAFEAAHPDIKVNHETTQNEQYKTKIKAAMSAGTDLPDVFFTWGMSFLGDFVNAGRVLCLDEYYDQYKDELAKNMCANASYDGKLYGVPYTMSCVVLFANMDLLAKAGWDHIPETIEDMNKCCDDLKAAGIVPFGVSGKELWCLSEYLEPLMIKSVGTQKLIDLYEGRASWKDEDVVKAAQAFQDYVTNEYFDPNAAALGNDEVKTNFIAGKYAFYQNGSWNCGDISKAENAASFKCGLFPVLNPANAGLYELVGLSAGADAGVGDELVQADLLLDHGRSLIEIGLAVVADEGLTGKHLVDSCLSNWKGTRGLFEDAGVAKEMEIHLEDSQTRASWAELLAAFGKVNTGE